MGDIMTACDLNIGHSDLNLYMLVDDNHSDLNLYMLVDDNEANKSTPEIL